MKKSIIIKSILSGIIIACLNLFHTGCTDISVDPFDNINNNDNIVSENFSFRVALTNQSLLRIEGVSGNVTIAGVSNFDSVIVTGEKKVASQSIQDAQEHFHELSVNFQNLENEIYLKTIQPEESNGRSYIVNYDITLPKNFAILSGTVNGSVKIDSITNNVTVNNINGTVTLNNLSGNTFVSMVNGNIKNKQSLPPNGSIDMTTVNGNIQLEIPQNTSAELTAGVVNGNINSSNLNFHSQSISTYSFRGTLGTGDGRIDLGTINGNITILGF